MKTEPIARIILLQAGWAIHRLAGGQGVGSIFERDGTQVEKAHWFPMAQKMVRRHC